MKWYEQTINIMKPAKCGARIGDKLKFWGHDFQVVDVFTFEDYDVLTVTPCK